MTHPDEMPAFAGNGAGPEQPHREGAARRHGAAQRPARARPRALGGGACARGTAGCEVDSGAKPRLRGRVADLPGVRGIARLGEAFALLPVIKRARARGAASVRGREGAGARWSASRALTAGARRWRAAHAGASLRSRCSAWRRRRSRCSDSELAAYHGVEHKAIAGYEQDTDAALAAKEHDRCGSNLVAPMIALDRRGQRAGALLLGLRGPVAGTVVTLAGVAVSVEMFAWSERHRETALAQAFRRPGYEMQRLFATREPTTEQLEVGRAALAEILRREAP